MKDTNYDLTLLYTIDQELAVIAGGYMYYSDREPHDSDILEALEKVFGKVDSALLRRIQAFCFKRIKDESQ